LSSIDWQETDDFSPSSLAVALGGKSAVEKGKTKGELLAVMGAVGKPERP